MLNVDALDFATILISIISAIFIAATSSWITVRLAISRFRDEKWWEKKVSAYEIVIEALHNLKVSSDAHCDAYFLHKELSDEQEKLFREQSESGRTAVERAVNIGSFILSPTCHDRLKAYLKDASSASNAPDYFTHLDEHGAAINRCLNDVIEMAKKDIRKS